jgi:hypothetical protein
LLGKRSTPWVMPPTFFFSLFRRGPAVLCRLANSWVQTILLPQPSE